MVFPMLTFGNYIARKARICGVQHVHVWPLSKRLLV
jgi:hypothetical protein